jgi:hypothetical protein
VPNRGSARIRPDARFGVTRNVCTRRGQLDVLPAPEEVLASSDDVDVVFAGPRHQADRGGVARQGPRRPRRSVAPGRSRSLAERILRELDRPTNTPDQLRAAGRRLDPQRRLGPVIAVYRELVP